MQYTTIFAEQKIFSRESGEGKREVQYTTIFARQRIEKETGIKKEEKVGIHGEVKIRKQTALRGWIGIDVRGFLLHRIEVEITDFTFFGIILPQYETNVVKAKVRGKIMQFTARILCGEEAQQDTEVAKYDYNKGMKMLEEATRVPKFYIDRIVVGLLNVIRTGQRIKIDMKNIDTKVEIGNGKVIIDYQFEDEQTF